MAMSRQDRVSAVGMDRPCPSEVLPGGSDGAETAASFGMVGVLWALCRWSLGGKYLGRGLLREEKAVMRPRGSEEGEASRPRLRMLPPWVWRQSRSSWRPTLVGLGNREPWHAR